MAKIYYNRIKAGAITIEDVPVRWREAVQQMLDAEQERKVKFTPLNTFVNTSEIKRNSNVFATDIYVGNNHFRDLTKMIKCNKL